MSAAWITFGYGLKMDERVYKPAARKQQIGTHEEEDDGSWMAKG